MSPRLLVVEPDPDVATVLELVGEGLGYEAVTAETLGEARAILGQQPLPVVLVVDLFTGNGPVLDFCRDVRAAWPALPIIALSTDPSAASEAAARAAGADHFFSEPFDPEALAVTIERLSKGL